MAVLILDPADTIGEPRRVRGGVYGVSATGGGALIESRDPGGAWYLVTTLEANTSVTIDAAARDVIRARSESRGTSVYLARLGPVDVSVQDGEVVR